MWTNLAAGTLLVLTTVLIHSVGLLSMSRLLRWAIGRLHLHRHGAGAMGAVVATVLGLFVLHTLEIWVWAMAYLWLGALPDLHDALFFSTLAFSTLGAEEISVAPDWRLFGAMEGVNGFLLIGWSTAYLIPAWTRYGPFHEERGF
ncbi:MAG: ion channel [Pseudomonadota bacterium]|nr:ion channel [Pseudomonadota bacterium]